MKKLALSLIAALGVVLGSNAQVDYHDYDTFYISGSAVTAWEWGDLTKNPLSSLGDNTYGITLPLKAGEFRINVQQDWWPCFSPIDAANQTIPGEGGTFKVHFVSSGLSFKLSDSGVYTVILDLSDDNNPVIKLSKDEESVVFPDLYITGGGTPIDWTNPGSNYLMDKDGTTYTKTIFLTSKKSDNRFIFMPQSAWEGYRFVSSTAGNARHNDIEPGIEYGLKKYPSTDVQSAGFQMAKTGVYTITVNLNDDAETGTMTLANADLCVCGPSVSGGWNAGELSKYPFTRLENGNYEITGDFRAGLFRINFKDKWAPCFMGASGENMPISKENGEYTLKWEPTDKSMEFLEDGNYTLLIDLNRDDDIPVLVVTYNCEYGEAPEVPLSELYICGNALNGREGGWNTSKDYVQEMTPTGNQGEFNWQGYLYGGCQFKFRYYGPDNGNWDGLKAEGTSDVPASSDFFTTNNYTLTEDNDYKFVVDKDGYYSVTAKTYGPKKTMDFLYLGPETGVAEISEAAVVTVDGRTVSVTGSARIFDIAGRAIANVSNGSATLPAPGLYIVVADGKASRILVK